MRIIRNAEEGRLALLTRRPLETDELPMEMRETIFKAFGQELAPEEVVRRVIRDVREDGDNAVRFYNSRFDGAQTTGDSLAVSNAEIRQAYNSVPEEVVEALRFAAGRVRTYHEQQLRGSLFNFNQGGLGQVMRGIERVAIYAPGARAPLPSTILMCAIPARVAGVEQVVIASPVLPDGTVPPVKLVAADIAGADTVYKCGGAQGIAALAYGTESIQRVDKICGPGGLFVTIAKKQVFGDVGIDAIYGPTETVIIADESADPELVAADLLAQAEHDPLASPILLTPSHYLADEVEKCIVRQIKGMERGKIAAAAFENRGGCILVNDIDHAIELANFYAPEHLCLCVEQPMAYAAKVKNAGGLFLGEASPEAVGDYTAGPSHTMPTGGSARWSSPLTVHDFLKTTSIINIPEDLTEELARMAGVLARAEGLTGHAHSVERRLQGR
ncbi:MAG: histidinol dehydrogenase [Chloroflexi bacterium]|nr:histidinol dehydrogenase [Chloroflexota bacterium]